MRVASIGLALALALGACGGGEKDLVSDRATTVLNAHVAEIRLAAAAADARRVRAEVAEMNGVVAQLQAQGNLSDKGAAAILAEAARVAESASLIVPTTTQRREPPSTAPIVTEPPKEDKDEGDSGEDDRGEGRGKGNKDGDDG
ncbi:MAG TPA: hypothetical protein VNB24_04560 [Acidimicrobiales bacterium]|nr:hypothetical protein [Acidimicrobiales bacterium]